MGNTHKTLHFTIAFVSSTNDIICVYSYVEEIKMNGGKGEYFKDIPWILRSC